MKRKDTITSVVGMAFSLNRSDKIRLKRAIGLTSDRLDIETKILFYSLFHDRIGIDSTFQNMLLLAASAACFQETNGNNKLSYILGKRYMNSSTSLSEKRRLSFLVAERSDHNNRFIKTMSEYIQSVIKKEGCIDIYDLANDLAFWDSETTKEKWLRAYTETNDFNKQKQNKEDE